MRKGDFWHEIQQRELIELAIAEHNNLSTGPGATNSTDSIITRKERYLEATTESST